MRPRFRMGGGRGGMEGHLLRPPTFLFLSTKAMGRVQLLDRDPKHMTMFFVTLNLELQTTQYSRRYIAFAKLVTTRPESPAAGTFSSI